MNDPDQPLSVEDDSPELTPDQEAEVRRLLVEARADEGVPADVAARLDRVLAQLHAGGGLAGPEAPLATVTELAARRRRRVTTLLGAAAAVVVVGIGLGQVIDTSSDSGSSGDSSAAGGAADSGSGSLSAEASAPRGAGGSPQVGDGADSSPLDTALPADGQAFAVLAPQAVSSTSFAEDVAAVLDATLSDADLTPVSPPDGSSSSSLPSLPALPDGFECAPAAWGPGVLVPVLYDASPALLAFRPTTGDTQVAELLQCGTGEVLRSVTLPAP